MQTTQPTRRPRLVKRGAQTANTVAQPAKRPLPSELRKVWQSERQTSTLSPRQQFNALFNS